MADAFEVHPDRLDAAAPKFEAAGGDLAAALTRLSSVLAGITAMCGDDEQGRTFAQGYEPKAKMIADSCTFASGALSEVATAVKAMADNYRELDETSARAAHTNGYVR